MAKPDDASTEDSSPDKGAQRKKGGKLPLIVGLVLAILCGAGGFLVVNLGLLGGTDDSAEHDDPVHDAAPQMPEVAFLPVDPLIVSLGPASNSRHLRFAATLEVPSDKAGDVQHLMPRISDALNSFLQAVEERDVASRDSLLRLRGQMLHRVRLVVGEDRVRDLLVSEFVLN